jgi:hypothetical protein
LTPGFNGIGTLTLGNNLTLQQGSLTTFLINSSNNYTSLSIQGGIVSYGGTLSLDLTSYVSTAAAGDSFSLFSTWGYDATNINDFSSLTAIGAAITFTDINRVWSGTNNGLIYQFSDSTGQLSVLSVPEPSTYVLIGLGVGMLIIFRRRSASSGS